ncbi:hypothetical protein GINT2_000111 [Glugoides intestinalis]
MTIVEYKTPEEEKKKTEQLKSHHDAIPAAKEILINQRSMPERMVKIIINTILSYIYWLFACVYLLAYSEELSEESKKGFRTLCLSKCLWDFQRDILLFVLGYFILLLVLNTFLFKHRN